MKKILVSSALATLLTIPAMAIEVYSDDEKDAKVDVYASIRTYAGYGSQLAEHRGSFLFGIQGNSQFGVRAKVGKFTANVQFGANEAGIAGNATNGTNYREYWGAYNSDFGQILVGKATSPTIDNGFTSNWLNNDNGFMGFGSIATGNRHMQIQYNVAGLSLALIQDTDTGAAGPSNNKEVPRIAVSYTIKNDKGQPFFKIAGTWKTYGNNGGLTKPETVNGNDVNVPAYFDKKVTAWHVWFAVKPTFGNAYISFLANYGQNGHLYGEQTTRQATGAYTLGEVMNSIEYLNARRAGALLEFGTKLAGDLSFAIGAGTQVTYGSNAQNAQGSTATKNIVGYTAFINLPYKVSKNFTFVPQVAYYNVDAVSKTGKNIESIYAATRFKFDF